jgi:hypothetical protein
LLTGIYSSTKADTVFKQSFYNPLLTSAAVGK